MEVEILEVEEHVEHFIKGVVGESGGLVDRLFEGRTFGVEKKRGRSM